MKRLSNFIFKDNFYYHDSTEFFGCVVIGKKTVIEKNCSIGKPHRNEVLKALLNKVEPAVQDENTVIGDDCYIEEGTIISAGVTLGKNIVCSAFSTIGQNSFIGDNSKIHYRAQIFRGVRIGLNSRIGGFICNDSVIGDNCSIYGKLVHKYRKHGGEEADKQTYGSPKFGNNVIAGFNSTVIGGIKINDNVYIAAGAIVTINVPSNSIVKNVNEISEWEY
jgi:acetyltransferase-like isoleucine patch superfamily enzyme